MSYIIHITAPHKWNNMNSNHHPLEVTIYITGNDVNRIYAEKKPHIQNKAIIKWFTQIIYFWDIINNLKNLFSLKQTTKIMQF